MKDRERKTHNRQHSILMDAKLVLLSQNVRVAISQSMLDYIYTCCPTKREARHKVNSWRVSQVEKKIDFKFFFVLPEIGVIEMQTMIILFSFSLTTVKRKHRSRRETTDLKKETRRRANTRRHTLRSRRGTHWTKVGLGAGAGFVAVVSFWGRRHKAPPLFKCYWIQLDQSCAILKQLDGYIIHFTIAIEENSFTAVMVFLSSGGWIPHFPIVFFCLLFPFYSRAVHTTTIPSIE